MSRAQATSPRIHPTVRSHRAKRLDRVGGILTEMGWIYRQRLAGRISVNEFKAASLHLQRMAQVIQVQEHLRQVDEGKELPFVGFGLIPPSRANGAAKPNGKGNGHANGGGNGHDKVIELEAMEAVDEDADP